MTPFMLYSAAATAQADEDTREELEAFAADLAAIQDLPEYKR